MESELALLSARVKACREEEGLTLLDLAERSGVAPSTVQKIEKGQMVPTIAVLMKIAAGLNTPPNSLAFRRGPAPRMRAVDDDGAAFARLIEMF